MKDLSNLATESPINLEQLRERLRKMTDAKLLEFGRASVHMCDPKNNHDGKPREVFVIQLAEARAEWQRRKKERESGG